MKSTYNLKVIKKI